MLKSITKLFITMYQKLISPMIPPRCRFQPTCSSYALECLETFSFHIALSKILKRILKCHPFHPGGYDPVIKNSGHHNCCHSNPEASSSGTAHQDKGSTSNNAIS